MNDLLLCQELAALLADPAGPYADFAAALPLIFPAQAAGSTGRPQLTVSREPWQYYGSDIRRGTLVLELLGRTGDQTSDAEHQALFVQLFTILLGHDLPTMAASKAALKAAILDRGKVKILDYGPAPEDTVTADFDGDDLRTVFKLAIFWQFV